MGRAMSVLSGSAAAMLPRPLANAGHVMAAFWHELTRHMLQSYRPELHYMRGPGPAWRAKHGELRGNKLG